jgi:hypothetical protein
VSTSLAVVARSRRCGSLCVSHGLSARTLGVQTSPPASSPVQQHQAHWAFGPSLLDRWLLRRPNTELCVQCVGDPPGQHPTAVPVHHRHQVHESSGERDVADVSRPYLIRPVDPQATQPVGIDPVPLPGRLVRGRGWTACSTI